LQYASNAAQERKAGDRRILGGSRDFDVGHGGAGAEALAAAEVQALAQMNARHQDALERCAAALAGKPDGHGGRRA